MTDPTIPLSMRALIYISIRECVTARRAAETIDRMWMLEIRRRLEEDKKKKTGRRKHSSLLGGRRVFWD